MDFKIWLACGLIVGLKAGTVIGEHFGRWHVKRRVIRMLQTELDYINSVFERREKWERLEQEWKRLGLVRVRGKLLREEVEEWLLGLPMR